VVLRVKPLVHRRLNLPRPRHRCSCVRERAPIEI
jgi:hypothetical protein